MPDAVQPEAPPAAVVETHTATLFFVGDRVYKLKKPVDLGFVDFSTREKRLAACHLEVDLNRRLAPDVYEGVADITGPDGALCDHLVVMHRMPEHLRLARCVERGDDVADALEEAAYLISLISDHHVKGWNDDVRKVLAQLAATVLQATQDHVKALAIARTLGVNSEAVDNDAFLAATWRVLQAERHCDVLLRKARRVILGAVQDAPSLMLANDLAATLELASDRLLAAGYALRDVAFDKAGVPG